MWKNRYKYYLTRDPQHVITAVSTIKTQNEFSNLNKFYQIDELEKDSLFKELYAYVLLLQGYDFVPVAFSDRIPKLNKLPKIKSFIEMHWCVGYVSPYLVSGTKSLISGCREIKSPSYDTLLLWLKHHVANYSESIHSSINQNLAIECLRKYLMENRNSVNISDNRYFKLVYNNSVEFIKKGTCIDWISHLENLSNRDYYEIIINEFE